MKSLETDYDKHQAAFDLLAQKAKQRQNKCHFAAHVAIKKGIMGVCRFNPILDVGCGNPYDGMYRFLQRFGWDGQYIGFDSKIPRQTLQQYQGDIVVKACEIDGGRLPLPPNQKDKTVRVSVGFCVDTMLKVKNKNALIKEMQRVSASVVVVGGVNEAELRVWGFQRIGYRDFGSIPEFWGVWLCPWAESLRHKMDTKAPTSIGYFESEDPGAIERRIFNCKFCGRPEPTGEQNFECRHCGKVNREVISV